MPIDPARHPAYNPRVMFRFRSKLAVGAAVTAVLLALYSALWLTAARATRAQIDAYIAGQRQKGVSLTSATESLDGFPFRLEVRLTGVAVDGLPHVPKGKLSAPTVIAWARPWRFDDWRFVLPGGATIEEPLDRVTLDRVSGDVSAVLGPGAVPDGMLARIRLSGLAFGDDGRTTKAGTATLSLRLPPAPPQSHEEPLFSFALEAGAIVLPAPVAPLGQQIDHLKLDATWRGPLTAGKLPDALAAWRDGGGTVELQSVDLAWGSLNIMADGTMALDRDLQPLGAFTARIMGYDAIIDALTENGALKANEGQLARFGLSMMAQRGADGTPQLKTPVTMQDGALYLGPARLVKLARIAWE
jgi:hypothetical protein